MPKTTICANIGDQLSSARCRLYSRARSMAGSATPQSSYQPTSATSLLRQLEIHFLFLWPLGCMLHHEPSLSHNAPLLRGLRAPARSSYTPDPAAKSTEVSHWYMLARRAQTYLEVILDPFVIHIFNAIHNRATSDGQCILVGERMWRLQTTLQRNTQSKRRILR